MRTSMQQAMRKAGILLFAICMCCALFSGCGKSAKQTSSVVYSFSGEHALFSISNGVLVLSPELEVFYGGDLQGEFPDITGYSMTFYIPFGNDKRVLMSNSVQDMTGETIDVTGELGKRRGDILTQAEIDQFPNELCFELVTTASDGKETAYQLQLTLTEIT